MAFSDLDAAGGGFVHVKLALFDGAAWNAMPLESQAGHAYGALVTANGATYTVLWAQPDPAGDPLVALPWAYDGLE